MAQITGSSTIDWSGISLAQIDFETDIVTFANRVTQIFNEAFPDPRVHCGGEVTPSRSDLSAVS